MGSAPVGGLPRGFDFLVRDIDSAMNFACQKKCQPATVLNAGRKGTREVRRDRRGIDQGALS